MAIMYKYVVENATIMSNGWLQINNMALEWLNVCLTNKWSRKNAKFVVLQWWYQNEWN